MSSAGGEHATRLGLAAGSSSRHLEQEHHGSRAVVGVQQRDFHPVHGCGGVHGQGLHSVPCVT